MQWRGLVKQLSHDGLDEVMAKEKMRVYSGFDPTASSMHVGNLMPTMALRRAQLAGHHPIVLVGGATGMIGDPSGKSSERNLLDMETLEKNVEGLSKQFSRFIDFDDATLVNNFDWFRGIGYLEFLREVGKHFSVNAMIARDSVRTRLEEREHGISYTEFSYMLIQAYDFWHLYKEHGCKLQLGGSEQWGNIASGIDIIRRLGGGEAYGMTLPLLLDASGKKFGKSEEGAIWLDPDRTSPYDFYQYFLRTDDRDVIRVLRYLTTLERERIDELEERHAAAPEKREAARELAQWMTALVHGEDEAKRAEASAKALFDPNVKGDLPPGTPTYACEASKLEAGWPLVDAIVESGLLPSKGKARKAIEQGGIYVNGERQSDTARTLTTADAEGGDVRLRHGKKNHMVLQPA